MILGICIKVGPDSTYIYIYIYIYIYVYYKLKQWFPFLEKTPSVEGENVEQDEDQPVTGKHQLSLH